MKKILVLLIIVASCLCMNGCNMKSNMRMDEKKYQKKLWKDMKKAIEKKNKNDFDRICSSKIKNNTYNKGIEYLFKQIDSDIIDVEMSNVDEKDYYEKGNNWRQIQCGYTVTLENDKYFIYIKAYIYYEKNRSVEGLSYIAIDQYDQHKLYYKNDDYFMYNTPKEGIYYPGWENDVDKSST